MLVLSFEATLPRKDEYFVTLRLFYRLTVANESLSRSNIICKFHSSIRKLWAVLYVYAVVKVNEMVAIIAWRSAQCGKHSLPFPPFFHFNLI